MFEPWIVVGNADRRAFDLYSRHYTATNRARKQRQFSGPGEKMTLLTPACDAVFVWTLNTVERFDGQEGVICTLFRNEGPGLASDLIRLADQLAWARWGIDRHFTYVDPEKLTRRNERHRRARPPGWSFLKAGWTPCGESKEGLIILEILRK